MKSIVILAMACAAPLLGCLKQQPVVQAPVIIDIPPMPKSAAIDSLPSDEARPRLTYVVPTGWDEESRQRDSVLLRNRDVLNAVITVNVEENVPTEGPDRDAENFHESIKASLIKHAVTASSYMFAGPNAEFVVVRYASEMGCGTSSYIRDTVTPLRLIVMNGEWPCDIDVESDAALRTFMNSVKYQTP